MKQISTNLTYLSIGLDIGDKRTVPSVESPWRWAPTALG
jgi:hypothetical protein